MNERIKKLKKYSLKAPCRLSAERARLLTEFYKNNKDVSSSAAVTRAKAFKYILENKKIYIHKDELIVGERGPEPKATPTYPEICLHSLEDLQVLDKREKVSFSSSEETRQIYNEVIIPFWEGKTQRDNIFREMDQEWIDAYKSGIFTEFLEQRAPGHTVLGDKIYKTGFIDLIELINAEIANLDFYNDTEALVKRQELKAMSIAADAMIMYAKRHAAALEKMAKAEQNTRKQKELLSIAKICRKVPGEKPESMHEALQYYWFVHIGVISELNPWDSFNPGRLDQHLYPFYEKDIKERILSKESAKELLHAFWIKFNNHPAPPKIGVTAKESNTYTDFALINLGGLKEDGSNAVNELSYLILDVIRELRILQPSSMIQVSKENPDSFISKAIDIIKTGFGQPSVFNAEAIIEELLKQGKNIIDARNGGASGCVETGAFGTESYILTGYFNLVKVLEITINNGYDIVSGKQIGIRTGHLKDHKSFSALLNAYKVQINHFINIKIKGNNIIEKLYAERLPVPFLSLLIDDCIKNARDYNAGGARYNTSYVQGVGLGTITDCLTSIEYNVYDKKKISARKLFYILEKNFEGHEDVQKELIHNTPKFGNDNDYADKNAKWVFDTFHEAVNDRPTNRGGRYRINMLPTTSHVYFGSLTTATPDGRKAFTPLSEGISPVQGTDKKGPTSVLKSAAKIDHLKTGGTLLNQKFTPQILQDHKGVSSLIHLIRTYFKMKGHHIQFNVVDAQTLRDAQKEPEKYSDLIVRVAGYSDYFNDLTEELQNEIIKRTEHQNF